ncbi:MAG: hypothetical protein RJA22_1630 [Verrucomicrobiota bacterium]|jgi:4-hydroxybenzoate polyprenyltransferase
MASLRTLLILGRVSNLPTVWSNCLAGWLLGGGGSPSHLALLAAGATAAYLGGMYLNDAFDAQFDAQHRPERPIPSGAIPLQAVWAWGLGWLALGVGLLCLFGQTTLILALLLALSILLYDAVHKLFAFSPILMAACRFFLLLAAASTSTHGVAGHPVTAGLPIWTALATALYVVGLSYVARKETTLDALSYWPCLCLGAPFLLAAIVNWGQPALHFLVLGILLVAWILRCLRFAFWAPQRHIGRTVGGLLAGLPLVDWLSVWDGSLWMAAAFAGCFLLSLASQRLVPAT